jgi:anti-sigma regulatory factor (Ser/Thr protein kinase)
MTADEVSFRVQARLSELDHLAMIVHQFGEKHDLSEKIVFALNLALDELITNSIKYGYKESGEHTILVRLSFVPGEVTLVMEDDGGPFNPLEAQEPDITCPVEQRAVGGLGLHLLRNLMDEIHYERRDGKNLVRIRKAIGTAFSETGQPLGEKMNGSR